MYEQIFEDFKIIQRHCRKNGNHDFEESAVFELLENLVPQYGPQESVQMVIEMLDAQRVRDDKIAPDKPAFEEETTDKSNDADSIIEVEVPKKIHPFIDLTTNSPESDESVIIEKTTFIDDPPKNVENNADSDIAENDFGQSDVDGIELSDYDISKHSVFNMNFNDNYNSNIDDLMKDNTVSPLISFYESLVDYKSELNESENNPSISEVVESSEMLEENNNDPNNNLESTNFYEEPTVLNNPFIGDQPSINEVFEDSTPDDALIKDLLDPVPGCSKYTDLRLNCRSVKDLPHTIVRPPASPTPGCSKDFENSNNAELPAKIDDSMINDAKCIQEIVPWANLDIIYTILKKYSDSPNRKQLTLWDLISQESDRWESTTSKRKQDSDECEVPKKSPKLEVPDDFDDSSMDLATNSHANNIAYDESSNDSKSSKASDSQEVNSEATKKNQNKPQDDSESFISSSLEQEFDDSNEDLKVFQNKKTNDHKNHTSLIDTMHSTPLKIKEEKELLKNSISETPQKSTNPPTLSSNIHIKKESQNESSNYLFRETTFRNNYIPIPLNNSSRKKPVSMSNASDSTSNKDNKVSNDNKQNKTQSKNMSVTLNSNKVNHVTTNNVQGNKSNEVAKIAKDLEKSVKSYIANSNAGTGTAKSDKDSSLDRGNVIKPPKFIFQKISASQPAIKKSEPSYIRPATFSYQNAIFQPEKMILKAVNKNMSNFKFENYPLNTARELMISTCTQPVSNQHKSSTITSCQANHGLVIPEIGIANHKQTNNSQAIKQSVSAGSVSKITTIQNVQQGFPGNIFRLVDKVKNVHGTIPLRPPVITTIASTPIMHKPAQKPLNMVKFVNSSQAAPVIDIAGEKPSTSGTTNLAYQVEPDQFVYRKLRSIFPTVEKTYVRKICLEPPGGKVISEREVLLNVLIEHLLEEGPNHVCTEPAKYEQPIVSTLSVDERYEYLVGIFPDADPTYLRNFVETSDQTDQSMQEFIQQKLETRSYPTKEQYLAKIKITEQLKQYTTEFKLSKFLELFPDPFSHFENGNRKGSYEPIAMEFLKSFFHRNKVTTISRQYQFNQYNVSLTAKALTNLGPDMKTKRSTQEMPTENIPLLQELCFIKNRQNILTHLSIIKVQEEQLFKEYQEKGLLITCKCCGDDECMPSKCAECNEGHIFCFVCIIRGTEVTLADGAAHVKCFAECQSEFSLVTLQKVLPPTKFSALLTKRQAAEVTAAKVEGLVSCPFCHFASIPPPEDKVFKCLNTDCMKETCRQCKELNHVPFKCDEVRSDKAHRIIEEKMTEALLRTCYKCQRQFYKEDGCNKMTCFCGALMCYICDKPIKDYKHFNAQGGANADLCPLWSDDRRLNAEAVIKVAEDVKKALLKNNPNLQINTDSLLPKLPKKTRGPHDDIVNANQLPEHIKRITNPAFLKL